MTMGAIINITMTWAQYNMYLLQYIGAVVKTINVAIICIGAVMNKFTLYKYIYLNQCMNQDDDGGPLYTRPGL